MKIVDPTLKTVSNYKHVNLQLDCNIFFLVLWSSFTKFSIALHVLKKKM
jgi:hypothetical protein